MKVVAKENLHQLRDILQIIEENTYSQKVEILSGASIGQHIRHILEFYIILVSGSFSGILSYDKRERDIRIEEDPKFAIKTIDKLLPGIDRLDETLAIKLEGNFTTKGTSNNSIPSSVMRELAYCIEHSIHHQAIIKAGLLAFGLKDLADNHFGVAYSTIRFRENKCAQ